MTDLTRNNNTHQKKSICVMSAPIIEGTEVGEITAVDADHLLGLLPQDAVIIDAFVWVHTVSDAATSAAATVGTTEGGSELVTGVDLTTLGRQGTFVPSVETLTGKDLWLGIDYTGATTAVGVYTVIVEYIEFNLNTGDLTQFS